MINGQTYKLKVTSNEEASLRRYRLVFEESIYDKDVFVTDAKTERSYAELDDPLPDSYTVSIRHGELNEKLLASHLSDWAPNIREVSLSKRLNLLEDKTLFQFVEVRRNDDGRFILGVRFGFDSGNWKRPWSFNEYLEEFSNVVETDTNLSVLQNENWPQMLMIALAEPDEANPLIEEVLKSKQAFESTHRLVEESLSSRIHADSVVVHFDFPEEVRVPCEQYLLYFVQFLKDIGVEATAQLHHEAGEVLFAVTPTDKDEALDKIRAALNTYLHLAASPVNSASVLSTDIEVQRLSANIQHLHGQLTLAHAVLQAKDATIQMQQTTIAQQRQMLTGEIVLESMKDVTPKPEDSEKVLGGLAEITKYEGKGFNLNLPEAFRRLRQLFNEKGGKK